MGRETKTWGRVAIPLFEPRPGPAHDKLETLGKQKKDGQTHTNTSCKK